MTNDLPIDVVMVTLSESGELLSSSSDLKDGGTQIPPYPSRTDFP